MLGLKLSPYFTDANPMKFHLDLHSRYSEVDKVRPFSGFALVEVLFAVGLLGILSLALISFMNDTSKSQKNIKIKMTSTSLSENLKRSAGSAKALTKTADYGAPVKKNADFLSCVVDDGTTDCVAAAAFKPLFLTDPSGSLIAGSPADPAYFSIDGASCALTGMASSNCPFMAKAHWRAECDGGAPSCKIARRVLVEAFLEPNPAYTNWGLGGKFKAIGGDPASGTDLSISIWNSVPLGTDFTGQAGYLARWVSDTEMGEASITQRKDTTTGRYSFGLNAVDDADVAIPNVGLHIKTRCDVAGTGYCGQLVVSNTNTNAAIQFRTQAGANGAAGLQWSQDNGNSFATMAMVRDPEPGFVYQVRTAVGGASGSARPFTFYENRGLCVKAMASAPGAGNCIAQRPVHLHGYTLLEDELEVKKKALFSGDAEVRGALAVIGAVTAATVTTPSDRRLKREIKNIENPLEKILALSEKQYEYSHQPGAKRLGFIAQEVRKIFPEVVREDAQGFLSISYGDLLAPLVGAVKKLAQKISALIEMQNQDHQTLKELQAQFLKQSKILEQQQQEIKVLREELRKQGAK